LHKREGSSNSLELHIYSRHITKLTTAFQFSTGECSPKRSSELKQFRSLKVGDGHRLGGSVHDTEVYDHEASLGRWAILRLGDIHCMLLGAGLWVLMLPYTVHIIPRVTRRTCILDYRKALSSECGWITFPRRLLVNFGEWNISSALLVSTSEGPSICVEELCMTSWRV